MSSLDLSTADCTHIELWFCTLKTWTKAVSMKKSLLETQHQKEKKIHFSEGGRSKGLSGGLGPTNRHTMGDPAQLSGSLRLYQHRKLKLVSVSS